mmetsp:Transcript_115690/g.338380  ORF Transcript_115690/g.338380 Transcript_115690/m.338380 type:complete len:363 (-) Transcript_115690:17-1105(-)
MSVGGIGRKEGGGRGQPRGLQGDLGKVQLVRQPDGPDAQARAPHVLGGPAVTCVRVQEDDVGHRSEVVRRPGDAVPVAAPREHEGQETLAHGAPHQLGALLVQELVGVPGHRLEAPVGVREAHPQDGGLREGRPVREAAAEEEVVGVPGEDVLEQGLEAVLLPEVPHLLLDVGEHAELVRVACRLPILRKHFNRLLIRAYLAFHPNLEELHPLAERGEGKEDRGEAGRIISAPDEDAHLLAASSVQKRRPPHLGLGSGRGRQADLGGLAGAHVPALVLLGEERAEDERGEDLPVGEQPPPRLLEPAGAPQLAARALAGEAAAGHASLLCGPAAHGSRETLAQGRRPGRTSLPHAAPPKRRWT